MECRGRKQSRRFRPHRNKSHRERVVEPPWLLFGIKFSHRLFPSTQAGMRYECASVGPVRNISSRSSTSPTVGGKEEATCVSDLSRWTSDSLSHLRPGVHFPWGVENHAEADAVRDGTVALGSPLYGSLHIPSGSWDVHTLP